jgi:large subunit ribosomal protein L18e
MISNTKIGKRVGNKTNSEVVETLLAAKKNVAWNKVAQVISGSRKKYASVNLKEIDGESKDGETIVVVGKVLGNGKINKKVRVCAMNFSESAFEKLKEVKSEGIILLEEIKKNPKAEGIKILR